MADVNNGVSPLNPSSTAQSIKASQNTEAAFIFFTDKGQNINKKLIEAKQALSPAAITRRIKNRGVGNAVTIADIPVNDEYLSAIVPKVTRIRHQLNLLNAVSVEATPEVLRELASLPFVRKITSIKSMKPRGKSRFQPPLRSAQNISSRTSALSQVTNTEVMQPELSDSPVSDSHILDYGFSLTQNALINIPEVHQLGLDGSGVTIAVLDSGFTLSHESLKNVSVQQQKNYVGDIGDNSHGTYVLSTIAGFRPGKLIGPAYGANYLLAKTENSEDELRIEEDNWCAGAQWAEEQGAQIIVSSLNYHYFFDGGEYNDGFEYLPEDLDGNQAVSTLCADAVAEKGVVVVNSAGNMGEYEENTLGAPADGHLVLTVGSLTSAGMRSDFSSVGLTADGRIKPDVMAMGSQVIVASIQSNTRYIRRNGTSFSTPLVAGVAALMLQANPDLRVTQVIDILRNTADNKDSPNHLYGYGKVDALAAVRQAQALKN